MQARYLDRPNHATSPAGCRIIRIAPASDHSNPAPYLPLQLKLQAQERIWQEHSNALKELPFVTKPISRYIFFQKMYTPAALGNK
ncbi:hypothetical protein EOL96_05770 [Candidatus Saccharibacteria bacterium]|nr:hypothetical protein [Candidatus Saccharibacteria bacterium]